jgi:predicted lipoprotein with Yx(FWY)xxD motif
VHAISASPHAPCHALEEIPMTHRANLAAFALAALLLAWGAAPAHAGYQGQPKVHQTDAGKFLADPDGTPLYTYEFDKAGLSNCFNTCTLTWPPERAADNATPAGRYGIIQRNDGIRQWTYNGLPLYGFSYDQKGGQPTGDDVAGFHLATVD